MNHHFLKLSDYTYMKSIPKDILIYMWDDAFIPIVYIAHRLDYFTEITKQNKYICQKK